MVQQFVEAVKILSSTSSDPQTLKAADRFLISWIQREDAWKTLLDVVRGNIPTDGILLHSVIFLRNKIMFDMHQVSLEQLNGLKLELVNGLKQYKQVAAIRKQLSLSYADLAIYLTREWTTPIEDISTYFPLNEEHNARVLLDVLTSLAEEIDNDRLLIDDSTRSEFAKTLSNTSAQVLNFLSQLISLLPSAPANSAILEAAASCFALWIPFCGVQLSAQVLHHSILSLTLPKVAEGDESSIKCFRSVVSRIDDWVLATMSSFSSAGGMFQKRRDSLQDATPDGRTAIGEELTKNKAILVSLLLPQALNGLRKARETEEERAEDLLCDLIFRMGRAMIKEIHENSNKLTDNYTDNNTSTSLDHHLNQNNSNLSSIHKNLTNSPTHNKLKLCRSPSSNALLEACFEATECTPLFKTSRSQGDATVPLRMFAAIHFWDNFCSSAAIDYEYEVFLHEEDVMVAAQAFGRIFDAITLPGSPYVVQHPGGIALESELDDLINFRTDLTENFARRVARKTPLLTSLLHPLLGRINAPNSTHQEKEAALFLTFGLLRGISMCDDSSGSDLLSLPPPDLREIAILLSSPDKFLSVSAPQNYLDAAIRTRYLEILGMCSPLLVSEVPDPQNPLMQQILQLIAHQLLLPRTDSELKAHQEWERQGLQACHIQAVTPLWDLKTAAVCALAEIATASPFHLAAHLISLHPVVVRTRDTLSFEQRKRLFDNFVPAPDQVLQVLDMYASPLFDEIRNQRNLYVESTSCNPAAATAAQKLIQLAVFELACLFRAVFYSRTKDQFLPPDTIRSNEAISTFVTQRLWPTIRDVTLFFPGDALLFERACKCLRTPLRLLGASKIRSILPEICSFMLSIFASQGHSSVLFVADWLSSLMFANPDCRDDAAILCDAVSTIALRLLGLTTNQVPQLLNVQIPGVDFASIRPPVDASSSTWHELLEDLFGLWAHIAYVSPSFVLSSQLLRPIFAIIETTFINAGPHAKREGFSLMRHIVLLSGTIQHFVENQTHQTKIIPYDALNELAAQHVSVDPSLSTSMRALQLTSHARELIAPIAQGLVNLLFRFLAEAPEVSLRATAIDTLHAICKAYPQEMFTVWVPQALDSLPIALVPTVLKNELIAGGDHRVHLVIDIGTEVSRRAFHLQRRLQTGTDGEVSK